jgi:hypothetical protein
LHPPQVQRVLRFAMGSRRLIPSASRGLGTLWNGYKLKFHGFSGGYLRVQTSGENQTEESAGFRGNSKARAESAGSECQILSTSGAFMASPRLGGAERCLQRFDSSQSHWRWCC